MVSTRGHRDNEHDEKSPLPSRECRKTNKTMQEPEDEIFWESDEIPNKSKRSATRIIKDEEEDSAEVHSAIQDETPKRRSSETRKSLEFPATNDRGIRSSKRQNYALLLSRSLRQDRRVRPWKPRRAHCQSCIEPTLRSPGSLSKIIETAPSRRGSGLSEHLDPPVESESEEEIFDNRRRHSTASHSKRTREKEIFNELEASDHESGLRRSSRKRTFQPYNEASWLVGDKKLKGYPAMIHSSEPENEEPRAARKSRYIRAPKTALPCRKSQKFSDTIQRELRKSRRYGSPRQTSRYTRRYQVEEVEEEPPEDPDNDENITEQDDAKPRVTERYSRRRNRRTTNHTTSRPRRVRHVEVRYEEESENSAEEIVTYRPRRTRDSSRHQKDLRSTTITNQANLQKKEQSSDSEKEEQEDEKNEDSKENEGETRRSRTRGTREPILRDLENGTMLNDVPRKRMRKPVSRLMYEASTSHRKRHSTSSNSSSSSSEDNQEPKHVQGKKRYALRQNRKPLHLADPFDESSLRHNRKDSLASYLHSPARKPVFTRRHRAAHGTAANSSSSSSEEKEFEKRKAKSMNKARNRCLPVNLKPEDLPLVGQKERKVGSSLADVDPMSLDTTINFESIGGLANHVKALKEMILFPIMYPEVFQKFSVTPPRGVLFYGPPGTGKTLVARALANECSLEDRKVAFFMRKGADCLSKWVGESERQLRLLFDQAYQMRPSIIFFDEIDGLAPVRSSRQDQIHSSIVSTLLALLDGIDSRGEIVIIGATNRIDAIDPALRRPGRFDREFHFPLPSVVARKQILKIHTSKWNPVLSDNMLGWLAERTVGYCGADLKSLCAEAALVALRSQFPQIYNSNKKLMLDVSKVQIKKRHFESCVSKIVPAGQRAASSPGRKLDYICLPLLNATLTGALSCVRKSFPHGFTKILNKSVVHRPRLIITGRKSQGQTTLLAPAMIHAMERLPAYKLDFPSLFSVSARAPEEACAQVFHEAKLTAPSILYVPLIDNLWLSASETIKSTFNFLLNDMESSVPVFLLATSSRPFVEMDPEVQELFSIYRGEVYVMSNPNAQQRKDLFSPLFFRKMLLLPLVRKKIGSAEPLPLAPPSTPRQLKEEEIMMLEEIEEASLRELRIFLRQICAKLAKNKMFYIFTKPVDLEEVPDYLEVISEPMDLETMMTNIDLHKYECAQDFLRDIELIVSNALEYNPDRNPDDKLIRHRACTLRDTAYAYIKAEMDTDFEGKCRDIRNNRKKRHRTPSRPPHFLALEAMENTPKTQNFNKIHNSELSEGTKKSPMIRKKKRKSNWCRGLISNKKRKIDRKDDDTNGVDSVDKIEEDDNSKDKTTDSEVPLVNGIINEDSQDSIKEMCTKGDTTLGSESQLTEGKTDTEETVTSETQKNNDTPESDIKKSITIDREKLQSAFDMCISVTEDCTVEQIRYLYSILSKILQAHRKSTDRNPMLKSVVSELRRFGKSLEEDDV